jgi:hypothetical protein
MVRRKAMCSTVVRRIDCGDQSVVEVVAKLLLRFFDFGACLFNAAFDELGFYFRFLSG